MTSKNTYRCAVVLVLIQVIFIFYFHYIIQSIAKENQVTTGKLKLGELHQEPIDVVFTWVNGSEERFLRELKTFGQGMKIQSDVNGARRFTEMNELKYALRSIDKHMPWVNHVWIVTNGQVPSWLNLDNGFATVIAHRDIFTDSSHLPTFSSPAIEANIFRIPGLSRRFLYFNDDWMIGSPVEYETFYTNSDGMKLYWEYTMPPCALRCPWSKVNDGRCDYYCYVPECQMDGNDCPTKPRAPHQLLKPRHTARDTMYSSSLQVTNRLFNKHFGFSIRHVMPHMPILVDKEAMAESWTQFSSELLNTSSHRFRDKYDMQFEFFYAFFVHHTMKNLELLDALKILDTNNNGILDANERKILLAKHFKRTPTYNETNYFINLLKGCDTTQANQNIKLLSKCEKLRNEVENTLMKEQKYKHTLMPVPPGHFFYMFRQIYSIYDQVVEILNDLRRSPRKFICLNDDLMHIQYMAKINEEINKEIIDFRESMLPFPSKYELPPGIINNFSYIQDKNTMLGIRNISPIASHVSNNISKLILIIFAVIVVLSCFYLFYSQQIFSNKVRLINYFETTMKV